MLKHLDPLLSPDLLYALASMGHGDTIALVDANFPGTARARRLITLPGIGAVPALLAVLSVLPLDTFVTAPAQTMQVVGDAAAMTEALADLGRAMRDCGAPEPEPIERFAFYEAAAQSFAIVQTGERRLYGNIIVRKGVIG